MASDLDLEQRLRRYGRVLDDAVPAPDTADGQRSRRSSRPRWPLYAVAAGVLIVVGLAAVAAQGGGTDTGGDVRAEQPAEDPFARPAPGQFPYLLIDGWEVERYDESRSDLGNGGRVLSPRHVQFFRDPTRGFDGPTASVLTLSDPTNYGIGEGPSVEVNGAPATMSSSGLSSNLSWSTQDGGLVIIRTVRLDGEQLLAFAEGLVRRTGWTGWDATALPAGLKAMPEVQPEVRDTYHLAETTFTRAGGQLDLSMEDGNAVVLEDLVEDRVSSADELTEVDVIGVPAALTHYEGDNRYSAMWFAEGVVYEIDGTAPGGREGFLAALGQLRSVDRATWEAALPAGAIVPTEREATIDRMLQGVEVPPGFDPAEVADDAETSDRYQLGARVAGGVACAWIDRWVTARDAGDTAVVDEALAAMQRSRSWPILQEMNTEGDYPEVVWELADEMAAGAPVETYADDSLGC